MQRTSSSKFIHIFLTVLSWAFKSFHILGKIGGWTFRKYSGQYLTHVRAAATYPATRLGRLPWQKLVVRFADELALLVFAIAVIAINLAGNFTSDTSLAATFLSRHPEQNQALYGRLFSTKTVVTRQGLIAQAQADEPITTTTTPVTTTTPPAITNIDEDGLYAAIPDSLQSLVNSELKIYDTKTGDTLASIALQFGVSVNTIKWANGLEADKIKPGWHLVIPSVNGVLVKADNNTTIAGIARKFKCTEERIISYNGLDGADSVEPGRYIMCPDGVVPAPVHPAVVPTKKSVGIEYASIPDIPGNPNSFVKGNCTWYVAKHMKITFSGNAKDWLPHAQAAGYRTGMVPMAGSAAVTSTGGKYGHVVFVEKVHSDGTITISEMNYKGLGIKTVRTLDASDIKGFIYPKE